MTKNIASELQINFFPKHVAIIMDGNGRWAKRRYLPRVSGHYQGVEAVLDIVKFCVDSPIEVLTLFAFSTENWQRSPYEVKVLMTLLMRLFTQEVYEINKNQIKLSVIGQLDTLNLKFQKAVKAAQDLTKNNKSLHLTIAVNYGGRWDITQAAKKIAFVVKQGKIEPEQITEAVMKNYLSQFELSEPELLIRTSGEQRISNFLLWQLAYAELYFTETLWPDFNHKDMEQALLWYSGRKRRFGSISQTTLAGQLNV